MGWRLHPRWDVFRVAHPIFSVGILIIETWALAVFYTCRYIILERCFLSGMVTRCRGMVKSRARQWRRP